jgi:hypothetical protein
VPAAAGTADAAWPGSGPSVAWYPPDLVISVKAGPQADPRVGHCVVGEPAGPAGLDVAAAGHAAKVGRDPALGQADAPHALRHGVLVMQQELQRPQPGRVSPRAEGRGAERGLWELLGLSGRTSLLLLAFTPALVFYFQAVKLFWRLLAEIQAGTLEQVYLSRCHPGWSPLPSWLVAAAGRLVAALAETVLVVAAIYGIISAPSSRCATHGTPRRCCPPPRWW